jgi:hypothetical protein
MKLFKSQTLLAMTLALAATAWFAESVKATPITYTTVGTVGTPPNGIANMIYFNGISTPTTLVSANGIDLGQFQISSLSATTTQTYSNTPFQLFVSSGSNQVAEIDGTLFGSVGPDAHAPITYTITGVKQSSSNPLFTIFPPTTPMTLNTTLPGGQAPAATDLSFAVTVPEPASVVVFAVSLGGLGVFARRRRVC